MGKEQNATNGKRRRAKGLVGFRKLIELRETFCRNQKKRFDPKGTIYRTVEAIVTSPERESYTTNLKQFLPRECLELFEEGLFEDVIEYAKGAPHDRIMRYIWGFSAFEIGRIDEAMTVTQSLIDQGYHHVNVHQLMRSLYLKRGDIERAEPEQIYAMFASKMEPSIACEYVAMLAEAIRDLEAAYFLADALFEMYPENIQCTTYLSSVMRLMNIEIFQQYDKNMQTKLRRSILPKIRVLNYATRNTWKLARSNREAIGQILERLPGDSLTIIGAGNCCHFDIKALRKRYKQLYLVDYDKYALGFARRVHDLEKDKNIKWLFNFDITGILEEITLWKYQPPDDEAIDAIIEKTTAMPRKWAGRTKVVVIDCILSTILTFLDDIIGTGQKRFPEMYETIVKTHYRHAFDSATLGGTIVSVLEQISSEYYKPLLTISKHGEEIGAILEELGRYEHLINPYLSVIRHKNILEEDPMLGQRIESVEIAKPWLWFYPGINYINSALIIKLKQ